MRRFMAVAAVCLMAACRSTTLEPLTPADPDPDLDPTPSTALLFASSYVSVPDDDRLDLTSTWTIEAWVRLAKAANGDQDIISKWAGGYSASYLLQVIGSGKLQLGTNTQEGETTFIISNTVLTDNTWYHVAATFDHGTAKIYVNGTLDTAFTGAYTPQVSYQPLTFGRESNYPAGILGGVIDEVRIWNIVRSEAEIAQSRTARLQGNEAGLVGYWPFEEGGGQITLDATANHLDGTLGESTEADPWDPAWTTAGMSVE